MSLACGDGFCATLPHGGKSEGQVCTEDTNHEGPAGFPKAALEVVRDQPTREGSPL